MMGRASVAIVVVLAAAVSGGTLGGLSGSLFGHDGVPRAEAKRAAPCDCAQTLRFPSYDQQDVPTNQQLIELDPDREVQFEITSLGELEPNMLYQPPGQPGLQFRTGRGPDLVLPTTPRDVHPSIAMRRARDADDLAARSDTTITMSGTYDGDTELIEVELIDHEGQRAHFALFGGNPFYTCSMPLRVSPGPAKIKVWALDLTGNRSAQPWEGDTTITATQTDPTGGECTRAHHVRCGMGTGLLYLLAVPVLLIVLVIAVFIGAVIQRSRIRNMAGEPITPLLGENVARIVAKGYLIKCAIGVVAMMALLRSDDEVTWFLTVMIGGPLVGGWLILLLRARLLVSRFETPVHILERRDNWLLVDRKLLYCGRRAWIRASYVPDASIARKNR